LRIKVSILISIQTMSRQIETPRLSFPHLVYHAEKVGHLSPKCINCEWKDIDLALMCLSTHCNRVRTESVEGSLLSAAVFVR
jgi:hypothetical protein